MATLERGKGNRKQIVEIAQLGRVLRKRETEAGDVRLPGYQRFADERAAREGLAAEVRKLVADGMQASDDDTRRVAGTEPASESGEAFLPIRCDLGIYNEATGFVVTSRRMAGKALAEGSRQWTKAVLQGDMLPLTLLQDDSFVIRIVAGAPLTAAEHAEWIARVDWHLNVADGKLCITGGSTFSNDDYDEDDPHYEAFVGEVSLPKGRYRAALYSYVHDINGAGALAEADAADDRELVDFLLHLEPVEAAPSTGLSALPDDGWFDGTENGRRPSRRLAGLPARAVIRRQREPIGVWTYVQDVFAKVPDLDRQAPIREALPLPLASLSLAVRIAWFASRFIAIELRLTPAPGARLDLDGKWPDGVVATVEDGGVGRILFDADIDTNEVLDRLPGVAGRLTALPEGTTLTVCSAPNHTFPGFPERAGLLLLSGVVRATGWWIERALPAVDHDTLARALALAAEVERGSAISVADDAEGQAILTWARRSFGDQLTINPPTLTAGAIRFRNPGHEVALVGIAAFAQRFARTWPVVDLTAFAGQ